MTDHSERKIVVNTRFNRYLIEQTVEHVGGAEDIHASITKNVIRLQDEGVRKALIELGWTPPKEPPISLEEVPI